MTTMTLEQVRDGLRKMKTFPDSLFSKWADVIDAHLAKGAQEWQPIETAPKGKKVIAGYVNALGNWRSVMATYYTPGTLELADDSDIDYDDDDYVSEGWYEECETADSLRLTEEHPTHWMPLTAAPMPSHRGEVE